MWANRFNNYCVFGRSYSTHPTLPNHLVLQNRNLHQMGFINDFDSNSKSIPIQSILRPCFNLVAFLGCWAQVYFWSNSQPIRAWAPAWIIAQLDNGIFNSSCFCKWTWHVSNFQAHRMDSGPLLRPNHKIECTLTSSTPMNIY